MRLTRFYFGRLNIVAEFSNKRQFIEHALRTTRLLNHRGFLWGFFDVAPLQSDHEFFTGQLAALRPEQPEEVGDLDRHALTFTNVANRLIAKSRFFLHVETGLIAYQFVSSHISSEIFCERFPRLFEEAHDNLFVSADIQYIKDRYSFLERLNALTEVYDVEFTLHPTNPGYSELYRLVDERLKRLNARQYREQLHAERAQGGLRIADDADVKAKAAMAEDGYGEATATGLERGNVTKITTRENPIAADAAIKDKEPEDIFAQLSTVFGRIFERLTRE
ncbi:MAG: hypothetical protein HOP28_16865 [Gemmatimonadales bacterium]|nr:hypothetical protein [Gemmatimonadales bacterium]